MRRYSSSRFLQMNKYSKVLCSTVHFEGKLWQDIAGCLNTGLMQCSCITRVMMARHCRMSSTVTLSLLLNHRIVPLFETGKDQFWIMYS